MAADPDLEKHKAWGLLTSLDLHECDPEIVENEDKLKRYLIEVCKLIDMKRYGEPQAIYFGSDPRVKGYTIYQLIETSMISGHFGLNPGGKTGFAYIDIFSCKSYDPDKAAEFTKKYFKAKSYNKNVLYRKYWFEEKFEVQKGRGLRFEIERKLVDIRSKYQHIQVFDTKAFGRMLVLDDTVMLTEFDEYAYHEMIAHVPLTVHPNPEKVLVIGGGDGGTIREITKHKDVKKIHLCDIDEEVINVSKKYFPNISSGFSDPRVKIHIADGTEFVKHNSDYDIIIVDSPDPVGPAKVLFTEQFYEYLHSALSYDGILVTQSESMFYHEDLISKLSEFIPKIFSRYFYYYTLVPTYPSGVIGFSFCSKKYHPVYDLNEKKAKQIKPVRYYNIDVHKGSFALPTFIKEKIFMHR